MVGGEEKGGVTSAPKQFLSAMKFQISALLLVFVLQTHAQTAPLPPIERSYSFGAWLVKHNLRGDVYRVGEQRFISPIRLKPFIEASGDAQALATFEQYRRKRRVGTLLDVTGGAVCATGSVLLMAGAFSGLFTGPGSPQRQESNRFLRAGVWTVVGGAALGISAKIPHRRAYEILHLSIDQYNGTVGVQVTRPF